MKATSKAALFCAAFACTLSACGAPESSSSLGALQQAIVNGEASDASDDAVVRVLTRISPMDGTDCTGTLIAPNLVVTALHCITYSEAGFFTCNPDGTVVPTNPGDGNIGQLVPAAQVSVYAGAQLGSEPDANGRRLFGTGSSQICRNDIGFIVLDRELDLPVANVRLEGPVERGEFVRVVGYGQTEVNGSSGRFRRNGVRVVDVGPESDAEPLGTAVARTFVVNEGPCHGDSGGPALSEQTGAVLGVYSLAAAETCTAVGVRNVFTRLASFAPLAFDAFTEAGFEPVLEVDPNQPGPRNDDGGCSLAAPAPTSLGPRWLLVLIGLAAARRRLAIARE